MGLGHNKAGTQGTGTEGGWYTECLEHTGTWTQCDLDKIGPAHKGTGTEGGWYTEGLVHNGAWTE